MANQDIERNDAAELARLLAELYELVSTGDGSGPERVAWAHRLAERFARARTQIAAELASNVDEAITRLRALREGIDARPLWQELERNYEALLVAIRRRRLPVPPDVRLPHLKPRNYWRNAFHVSTGLGGVLLYELAFGRTGALILAGSILAAFALLDLMRRLHPLTNSLFMRHVFGRISRPAEAHRIPSATWYIAALFLGVLFLPQRAVELGTLVLAFADPAASLVGTRFGRTRWFGEKSLEGTLAFVATALVVGAVFFALVGPGPSVTRAALAVVAAALAGAAAELISTRLDDNFTVPLAAGIATALVL